MTIRFSLSLLIAVFLPMALVFAQTTTATHQLTAGQRAAVVTLVAAENARRAAEVPPRSAVTVQQYADAACRAPFLDYVERENTVAVRAAEVEARWKASTPAQRAAALAALAPAPPQ